MDEAVQFICTIYLIIFITLILVCLVCMKTFFFKLHRYTNETVLDKQYRFRIKTDLDKQ